MEEKEKNNDRFFSACLELTDICRVGCPYCLLENKKPEYTKEQIIRIVHALREYGVVRFSVGGGEPLDIPYIYEVGEKIREKGGISLLRTSACNPINIQLVQKAFNQIDISLDSKNINTLRICKPGIDGHIPLNNIIQLAAYKFPVRCNILVTRYNYYDVLSTITWLSDHGIKDVRIQRLVPRGKAKKIYEKIHVPEELFSAIVYDAISLGQQLGITISELKTVNSQTLCIVKPDGTIYVGTPTGLIEIGSVFNPIALDKASSMVAENQKKYYTVQSYD